MAERLLYLQCERGISGDMVVGALLDAGASEEGLRAALASLPLEGYEVRVSRKRVQALDACDFDVVLDADHDGHDHDMAYLYGNLDGGETHERHHDHDHGHDHGHHHHDHRNLADVLAVIDAGDLTPHARALAHRIFGIIEDAEAEAHGVPREEVHFHEVGAVDSIVDVVAAAWCVDALQVSGVVVGPLSEGHGRVRAAHGVLPVPVPAVANIVAANGLVLRQMDREGEFVTPTGAAIAAALRTSDQLPAAYRVLASGLGAGKRAYDPPSTVRALLVEPVRVAGAPAEQVRPTPPSAPSFSPAAPLWELQTEVDDTAGEALGHTLDRLMAAGAREAHFVPVYMKKNRPGYQVQVICDEKDVETLEGVLFADTTTIGIRRLPLWRTALAREQVTLRTPLGPVAAKRVTLPSGEVRTYPEHDAVAALAARAGLGYQDAYRMAIAAAIG